MKSFLNGSIDQLNEKFNLVLISSQGKELTELHEKYGVRTLEVPMERHMSIAKDIKSLWQMIKVFYAEKPYIVHSMTPKAGLICMIAALIARVPRRVHTFTGLVWPTAVGHKRKILMLTDKILCACATHIIPEGEGVKNDLQTHITKMPMRVLGFGNVRGVDMDFWKVTPLIKDQSEELRGKFLGNSIRGSKKCFNFIFVGRLVGDKGINELIVAFLKLHDYYLNLHSNQAIRLILVGSPEDSLDPLKQITWDRIKSTPSIIEVGPVWGNDILKYYSASDCLVMPSYREGFPNTVLEAGAMGLPSIVTDINGSREIIENGKNGFIVPSKDINALYKAMKRMMEDKDTYKIMASNARPMVESRFEQSFVRKCLFDFYDEIM